MAFTTTQLAAIEAAIASGELTVSYDGKTVTYRNMADLKEAYSIIKAALEADGTLTESKSVSYVSYRRD